MSGTTPPAPPPGDPRGGNPLNPGTWIAIIGVIIVIVVVGSINFLNRGGGQPPPSASNGPTGSAASGSPSEALSGTYLVIFKGQGTGHQDRPDNGQGFKSADATASWQLEFAIAGPAPSPSLSSVQGTGTYAVYRGTSACSATAVRYLETEQIFSVGPDGTYTVTPPMVADLQSSAGCDPNQGQGDPFYQAFGAWCPAPTASGGAPDDCGSKLAAFDVFSFSIAPGQTGTQVTTIPERSFEYTTPGGNGTVSGNHSKHSWSGSVTVVAQ